MAKGVPEKKKSSIRSGKNVMELDLDEPVPKSRKSTTRSSKAKESPKPSNTVKKSRKSISTRKKPNTFDEYEFTNETLKLGRVIKKINKDNVKKHLPKKEVDDDLGVKYYDEEFDSESDNESSGSDNENDNEPISTNTVKKNSKYFNSQIRAHASVENTTKILKIAKTTDMRTKSIIEKMEMMEHQLEIIKDSLEQQEERLHEESEDAPTIDFAPIVSDEIELDPSQKKNISRLVDEFKGFIDLSDDVIRQHLGKHTPIADVNLLKICYIKNIPKNKVCIRCLSEQNYQYYANGEWHTDKYGRYIREVLAKNVMRLYLSVNKMEYYFPNTPENGIVINTHKSTKELEKEKLKQDTHARNLEYISSIQKSSPTRREKYEKDLLNRLKHDLFYRVKTYS